MKINKIIGLSFIIISFLITIIYFIKKEVNIVKYQKYIENKIVNDNDYYAILKIPKINLTRELFSLNDERNNIKDNVLVHEKSTFPKEKYSNVILASHSGDGTKSYFKNLYKLEVNDLIYLYFENYIYEYQIIEIDYQKKIGELYLNNYNEEMITLITCTKNSAKLQTIYYGKLKNSKKIEKND